MKYTRSKDGVFRINLTAKVRVTRDEVQELRELAKVEGFATLNEFLIDCLRDGIVAVRVRREADRDVREMLGEP